MFNRIKAPCHPIASQHCFIQAVENLKDSDADEFQSAQRLVSLNEFRAKT